LGSSGKPIDLIDKEQTMATQLTIAKRVLYVVLLATAQPNWANDGIDCSDPAYSYLPGCDGQKNPGLPSAAQHEQYLDKKDTVRENKAKLGCKKKKTAEARQQCLDNLP
jgi:hypothetical protein